MSERIEIWTDGACLGNPGPGGWGVVMRRRGTIDEKSGGVADTTNNRMELTAAIEALSSQQAGDSIVLHTDSTYVCDGLTKWLAGWKARGWKTAAGKPVKNRDLWTRLDAARRPMSVEWRWVKAHAGIEGNERADTLAREAALEAARSAASAPVLP